MVLNFTSLFFCVIFICIRKWAVYDTKKIKKKDFDYFYSLLEKDFCFDERKSKEDQLKSFKNSDEFKTYFIYDENNVVGYFIYWDFSDFIFGEHFAILEEIRNKGNGTNFLTEYLKTIDKLFIFEVERPHDEISRRRINFYTGNGIVINNFDYYQPSYHNDNSAVPMYIASFPRKISEEEYFKYTKLVKNKVYSNNKK